MANSTMGLAATQYGEANEQADPGFQQISGVLRKSIRDLGNVTTSHHEK